MTIKKIGFGFHLLYILLILVFITSVTYALASGDSQASAVQNSLKVAFVDNAGNIITDCLFDGSDIYPGRSKAYHLRVKNFGIDAKYSVKFDFPYDNTKDTPNLADVLSVRIRKGASETTYRLTDFLNQSFVERAPIKSGDFHDTKIILSMDSSAGNEYQLLDFNLSVDLSAESAEVSHHEHPHYNRGNIEREVKVIKNKNRTQ